MLDNLLLLALVCAAGAFVSGLSGFGSGMVMMGSLVALLDFQVASSVSAIISVSLALVNLLSVWRHVPWDEIWRPLVTALPMVAVGVFLLQNLDDTILKSMLAFIILTGCAITVWAPKGKDLRWRGWAYVTGAVAGLFGGSMNTGGPPVVLYSLLSDWPKEKSKGYMSFLFLTMVILRIGLLTSNGLMPQEVVLTGLALLVPVFAAWYAGKSVFARLSNERFRWIAIIVLFAIAVRLVVTL